MLVEPGGGGGGGGVATPRFAVSEDDARARFEVWRGVDPYPEISAALLNSADIADYVAATGLIHPFDEARLKPASYPLTLGGKVLCWDNTTRRRFTKELQPGDTFTLQPNAIAFVSLCEHLQLPDYIALRFNLRIANIYRGLLLGTGPLIDPGFAGKLSFPLHNLTTNTYYFRGGEQVIWVEFTKISEVQTWRPTSMPSEPPEREGVYHPYRLAPSRKDVESYVGEALQSSDSDHVWSSISQALRRADLAVRRARFINFAAGIALLALVIGILGVVAVLWWDQVQAPTRGDLNRTNTGVAQLKTEITQLQKQLAHLERSKH